MNCIFVTRLLGVFVLVLMLASSGGCGSASRVSAPPGASDPNVVAVFGDEILTLDEFESRYVRTVGSRDAAADDSLAEYQDFLERYVNFRLKVEAATAAGIPTSPEVVDEIKTYQANLARPYLLEQEVIDPIVRQLYERQKVLVDVSHILVRLEPSASPQDSLAAFERLEAIRDSALQGVDFGDLAQRNSEDPSASARADGVGYRGRLGYFTAGRMIEPFETYAYETPVGDVSPIFRTRFGFHVLQVHDRRDAVPDRRLAHIMMRPNPTPEDSAQTMATMRGLAQRISAGESFADLAEEYSIDGQSKPRGGDLGFIGFDANLPPKFKEAAFGIPEIGGVSDVVQTPYGYHLVTWTDVRERKSFDDAYDELKNLASRLPRKQAAEEALARRVVRERAAIIDTAFVLSTFESVPPDSVFPRIAGSDFPDDAADHPILVIGDSTYTLADVSEYVGAERLDRSGGTERRLASLLTVFVTEKAIEFEAAELERRDGEFARIMDEFRDGLVLFQFMEDSVWTAAERDTSALERYYDVHRDEYWWPDRTRIISLRSTSDSVLTGIGRLLDSGASVADVEASFRDDTLNTVSIDTMLVSEPTKSVYDQALDLEPGERTKSINFRGAYMLLVNDGVETSRQKTFDEARTQVVSDYQTIVEDRLIEKLRAEYGARTYPSRLVNAFTSQNVSSRASGVATGE